VTIRRPHRHVDASTGLTGLERPAPVDAEDLGRLGEDDFERLVIGPPAIGELDTGRRTSSCERVTKGLVQSMVQYVVQGSVQPLGHSHQGSHRRASQPGWGAVR
jgi:hypothetical protein